MPIQPDTRLDSVAGEDLVAQRIAAGEKQAGMLRAPLGAN